MSRPIITFTTDFGTGSVYVAEMKGVALSICPEAVLVDITHAVPPQNVRAGAFYLAQAPPRFPPGSIHVAVVDPGVGSARKIVVVKAEGRIYVAPDNGLLSLVAPREKIEQLVEANQPRFWLDDVSHTFHGRDIMTSVAAHVANGVSLEELGPPYERLKELDWPTAHWTADGLRGEVIVVDSFGNLITNIRRSDLRQGAPPTIRCGTATIRGMQTNYAARSAGELIALIGSSEWLELAEVDGSAAQRLGAESGTAVYVQWQ